MDSPGCSDGSSPPRPSRGQDTDACSAAQLVAQAADLAASQRYREAAVMFEQALAAHPAGPGAAAAHEMLAQCLLAEGDDEGACAAAAAALRLRPGWHPALLTLGRAARNAGRLREAEEALVAYLDAVPSGALVVGEHYAAMVAAGAAGPAAPAPDQVDSRPHQGNSQQPWDQQQQQRLQLGAADKKPAGNTALGAAEEEAEEGTEEARQELAEVRQLLQAQLGHQLGLPGLRLLERHDSSAGPGGAAWEAGALLAWFLAQQAHRAPLGKIGRSCGEVECSGGCAQADLTASDNAARSIHPTSSAAGGCSAGGGASGATLTPADGGGSGSRCSALRGACVLELGSGGTGLVGLAAACLGAEVVATDLPEVLPQLEAAVALNAGVVAAGGGSVRCATLDWRQPGGAVLLPEGPPAQQYSWLLGADLVYSLAPVPALVGAVAAAAAHAEAVAGRPLNILIAHKHRHDEVDAALLQGLRAKGLAMRAVLRDAGSRCTVYANEAAAAALQAPGL